MRCGSNIPKGTIGTCTIRDDATEDTPKSTGRLRQDDSKNEKTVK